VNSQALRVGTLRGGDAERYLSRLVSLISAARLNKFFPDPAHLRNLYAAMRPSLSRGLYPELALSPSNGLPAERAVSRVQADAQLAGKYLRENPRETLLAAAERTDLDAARRMVDRRDYYATLAEAPPCPAVNLQLALRRVDPETQTAHFTVMFDRYDLSESLFVRYTILLRQTANRWTRQQVELVGDDLAFTENFRNAISRFTSDEAEFAFLLLSDLPRVAVEDVIRGRVGPLWTRGAEMPNDFAALFEQFPEAAVLHFPMDRAGRNVPREGRSDPLATLYREFLDEETRAPVDARARALTYKVWKERKFAATADISRPLQELLKGRGTPCVVRAAQ